MTDDDDLNNFTIDPSVTKLSNLLEIAEASDRGNVQIRGDLADGSTQWGTIVVFGPRAGIIMDKLQELLNEDALLVAKPGDTGHSQKNHN